MKHQNKNKKRKNENRKFSIFTVFTLSMETGVKNLNLACYTCAIKTHLIGSHLIV